MTRVESPKSSLPLQGLSVCFDLDGTLVDTAPDLVRVTNEVIALEGLPPTNYRKARAVVSLGSARLIRDALARANVTIGDERFDELRTQFLLRYSETLSLGSVTYPGVEETLSELRSLGAELSVCTNKPGWLARPLIRDLGLDRHMSRIVGGDDVRAAKPSAGHVFAAAGHRRSECIVMVGDSFPDMRGGLNAKAFTVLMTYGYSHTPQIRLRADARLRSFRSLTPTLMSVFRNRRTRCGSGWRS